MRIAMIGIRGVPARWGGAEHVVEELSRELADMGHEVLVYSRRSYVGDRPAPPWVRSIVTASLPGKHFETISHTATALLDLRKQDVDLVHLHSPGPALLSWLPALQGLPVVLTIHAPDWERARWSAPARLALRAGLKIGARFARAITAVSWPLAQDLTQLLGREVVYVPNGVRMPLPADPALVEALGLEPGRYALTVGRIVPEKRLDLLLEAWPAAGVDWPLGVVGGIQDRSFGRRCARLAGNANVRMLGEQTGDALSSLYQYSGLVVLPSELEGMSLVLLEALAHGCCVLAADIRANVVAFGDSIVCFKCGGKMDLTGQIRRLWLDPSLRRQCARLGRQRAREYGWSDCAAAMLAIYRRLARRKELA